MIASDFIKRKVYTDQKSTNSNLIDYVIIYNLYKSKCTSLQLKRILNYYLDRNEYISDKEFELYLNIEFELIDNENYVLIESESNKYKKFLELYSFLDEYISESKKTLRLKLNNCNDINEVIGISVILSNNDLNEIVIKSECFNIYTNLDSCNYLFNEFINTIKKVNSEELIFEYINYFVGIPVMAQTEYQKKILGLYNIKRFDNLLELEFKKVIEIFIENPLHYLQQLNELSPEIFNSVCNKFANEIFKMKDNQREIFKYRLRSAHDEEYLTLQDLGDKLNLTRERVRQVEAKIYRHLSEVKINNSVIVNLFNYYDVDNKRYLNLEKFVKIFNDKNIRKYFVTYMDRNPHINIKINLDNDVVYDSTRITVNEILGELDEIIPNVVNIEKYNEYFGLEKSFIEKNYHMTKKRVYLKKGMPESDTYLTLLDDLFPKGYRIASDEDFEYLMNKYQELYDTETPTTKRYVASKLDRSQEYCLCNRGTYIKYTKCRHLSDDLLIKIIDYIKSSKYTVYYSEILNRFRIDLAMEQINNQFLLKGLLDHNLTDEYQTNRDSITYGNQISKLEAIVNYMKNQNGIFSLTDINYEFPDVQYTVLQGIISYESNYNGLLILYDKKFIYADKSNIESLKEKLKSRIDNLLFSLNSDFVTSHKLYANIALSGNNIFENISFEVDGFNTYSIVRYLYPDEYFYRRPIISKLDKGTITTINAIHDYLIEFDSFNDEISSKYITKMNLSFKWINVYQELCNYMSNEFLQINKKTMLKIDNLNIDSYIIDKIDNILSGLVERYKEINITDYNAYFIFPNINELKWNEYMVIGFINSYLNDKYEFYMKENKYYIRRLDYEL